MNFENIASFSFAELGKYSDIVAIDHSLKLYIYIYIYPVSTEYGHSHTFRRPPPYLQLPHPMYLPRPQLYSSDLNHLLVFTFFFRLL